MALTWRLRVGMPNADQKQPMPAWLLRGSAAATTRVTLLDTAGAGVWSREGKAAPLFSTTAAA